MDEQYKSSSERARYEKMSDAEFLLDIAHDYDFTAGPKEIHERLTKIASTLSERGLCAWTPDDDGVYQTGCGEAFTFIDAGPKENGMKFCCYCGITMSERPNERNSGSK